MLLFYKSHKYYNELGSKWIPFINKYCKDEKNISLLPKGGSCLDLKQNICHCIGISDFINRKAIDENLDGVYSKWQHLNNYPESSNIDLEEIYKYNFSKYIFMNLEYEPDKDEYPDLYERYIDAEKYGNNFGAAVFNEKIFEPKTFEYHFYSYKDFANKCLPEGEHKKSFMKKYLIKRTKGE